MEPKKIFTVYFKTCKLSPSHPKPLIWACTTKAFLGTDAAFKILKGFKLGLHNLVKVEEGFEGETYVNIKCKELESTN